MDPTYYFLFCNLLRDGIDATITRSLCVFCKRNNNIKTYFLGSILSAASVLLTITTFQKRQMYKINIDAVWHRQYKIRFCTMKIDFFIRLEKILLFDFYLGLSEHLMGVWSSLNNKKQSINDKSKINISYRLNLMDTFCKAVDKQ